MVCWGQHGVSNLCSYLRKQIFRIHAINQFSFCSVSRLDSDCVNHDFPASNVLEMNSFFVSQMKILDIALRYTLSFRSFKTVTNRTYSLISLFIKRMRSIYVEPLCAGAVAQSKWGGRVWRLKHWYNKNFYLNLESCFTKQRTPMSQGIVHFFPSKFEGIKMH